jgi:hypothetical protein
MHEVSHPVVPILAFGFRVFILIFATSLMMFIIIILQMALLLY